VTTYLLTLADRTAVEVHAPTQSAAFQIGAYLHTPDDLSFPPTEKELIMNLYMITFWPDPEDPDNIVEVQIGAKTEELALAEARLQHPELADVQCSIALEWRGKR